MRRRTYEDIKNVAEKDGYALIDYYFTEDNQSRVIVSDNENYVYDVPTPSMLNHGRLAPFHKWQKFTLQNIKNWLKLNKKSFSLTENNTVFNGWNDKMEFYCYDCDDCFYLDWANIFSCNRGCPMHPGGRIQIGNKNSLRYLRPDLMDEWDDNNSISPDEVSIGCHKKVNWICSKCGDEWMATIHDRAGVGKRGCPYCRFSKGEKKVQLFLNNNNLKYIAQYKFDECKSIRPLPFDFYLPDHNVLIEYQGQQHYEITRRMKLYVDRVEMLNKIQKRDVIKSNFCKDNNIPFIVIPYWDYDYIDDILIKELNL